MHASFHASQVPFFNGSEVPRTRYPFVDVNSVNVVSQWNLQPVDSADANVFSETPTYGPTLITLGKEFALDAETMPRMQYRLASAAELRFPDPSQCDKTDGMPDPRFVNSTICGGRDWRELCNVSANGVLSPATILYNVNVSTPISFSPDGNITAYSYELRNISVPCRRPEPTAEQTLNGTALPLFPGFDPIQRFVLPGSTVNIVFNVTDVPEPPVWRPSTSIVIAANFTAAPPPVTTSGVVGTCQARSENMDVQVAVSAPLGAPESFPVGPEVLLTEDDAGDVLTLELVDQPPAAAGVADTAGHSARFKAVLRNLDSSAGLQVLNAGSSVTVARAAGQSGSRLRVGVSLQVAQSGGLQAPTGDPRLFARLRATDTEGLVSFMDVTVNVASLTPLGGVAVLPASVAHEVSITEPAASTQVGVYVHPTVSWVVSGLLPPAGNSLASTLPAWMTVAPMRGTGPTLVTVATNASGLPQGLLQSQLLFSSLFTPPAGQPSSLTEEDLVAVVPVEALMSAPAAVLQPTTVSASAQPAGSAAESDLVILNTGTFPMTYTLVVADAGAGDFIVLRPVSSTTGNLLPRTNTTSGTISPGGSATVVVVTSPATLSTGEFKGALLLTSNDAARPRISVPVSLRVSWIALCPDELQLSAAPNGYTEEVVELTNLSPFDISVALDVGGMPEAFIRGSPLVPPTGAQITLATSDNRLPVSLPPRTLALSLHYASAESLLPGTYTTQLTVVSWRTTAVERGIQAAIADPLVKAGFIADLDTYLSSVGATFVERRVVTVRYTLLPGASSADTSFLSGPRLDVLQALQTATPVEAAASQAPVFGAPSTPAPSPSISPSPLPSPSAEPTIQVIEPSPAATPFTPAALPRVLPANKIMHASITVGDAFGFAGAEQPLGALAVTVDGYSAAVVASLTEARRTQAASSEASADVSVLAQRLQAGHRRAQAAHTEGQLRAAAALTHAQTAVRGLASTANAPTRANLKATAALGALEAERTAAEQQAAEAHAHMQQAQHNKPAAGTVPEYEMVRMRKSHAGVAAVSSIREPAVGEDSLTALQAARHTGAEFWGAGAGGHGKELGYYGIAVHWKHARTAHLPRSGRGSLYAAPAAETAASAPALLAAEQQWLQDSPQRDGPLPMYLVQLLSAQFMTRHADTGAPVMDVAAMEVASRMRHSLSKAQRRQLMNMREWHQAGEANAHQRHRSASAGRQTHQHERPDPRYLRPVGGSTYFGEQHQRRLSLLPADAAEEAAMPQAPLLTHDELQATTHRAAMAHILHTAPQLDTAASLGTLASLGVSSAHQVRRSGAREPAAAPPGPRLDAGDLRDGSRRHGMLQQWSFPLHGRQAQAMESSPLATVTVVYEGTPVSAGAGNSSSLTRLQQEGLGLYSVYVRPLRRGTAVLRATVAGGQIIGSGHIFTIEGAQCNPFNTTQSSSGLQCQCAGGFSLDVAAAAGGSNEVVSSADAALTCVPCSPGFEKPRAGNAPTCDVCPDQSYSVGGTFPCQPCLASEGADCSGGRLSIRDGYWFAQSDVIPLEQAYSTTSAAAALNVTRAAVVLDLHRQMRLISSNSTAPARLLALSPGAVLHRCPGDQCVVGAGGTDVQCKQGSRGPMCAVCDRGFESNNGLAGAPCNECPSFGVSVFITVLVFGAMSAAVTVAALQQRSAERTMSGKAAVTQTQSMVRILLNWLQASAVLGSMQLVGLSPLLSSALGVGTAAEGFSLGFYPVRCALQLDFYETLYAYLIMPFVAVLVPHAVALGAWQAAACGLCGSQHAAAAARATRRRGAASRNALATAAAGVASASPSPPSRAASPPGSPPAQPLAPARGPTQSMRLAITSDASTLLLRRFMGRATTSAIVLLFLLHFTLLRSITRVFVLYKFPIDGVTYIANDFTASTDDAQYPTALGLAVAGLVLYIMGIPALGIGVLYRNKENLQRATFAARFSFLYSGLKLTQDGWLYMWEGIVLLRKIAMVFIATFAADNALQQGYLAVLLLVIALLLQVRFEPYDRAIVNQLETAALSTLLFTQIGILYYASTPTEPVAVLVVLINAVMALVFAILILTSSSKGMLKMARRAAELASKAANLCCPRRCRDSMQRVVEDLRFAETGQAAGGKGSVRAAIRSVLGGSSAASQGKPVTNARSGLRPRADSPTRITADNPMFANRQLADRSGGSSDANGSDGDEQGIEMASPKDRSRVQGDVSRVMYYASQRGSPASKDASAKIARRTSTVQSSSFTPEMAARRSTFSQSAGSLPSDAPARRKGTITRKMSRSGRNQQAPARK